MEGDSLSLTAIIGIIGALLTVLIKLFDAISSWKKSRDSEVKEKRGIDQVNKEVNFINTWLSAVSNAATGNELESRKSLALARLDQLMESNKAQMSQAEKLRTVVTDKPKSNTGFYAMSIFLVFAILGLFIDEEDNYSLNYFYENLDSETLLGFIFFLAIWVYFLINSKFFSKNSRP